MVCPWLSVSRSRVSISSWLSGITAQEVLLHPCLRGAEVAAARVRWSACTNAQPGVAQELQALSALRAWLEFLSIPGCCLLPVQRSRARVAAAASIRAASLKRSSFERAVRTDLGASVQGLCGIAARGVASGHWSFSLGVAEGYNCLFSRL